MFHLFPANYMWSQATLRVMFTGGSIGEVGVAVDKLGKHAASYDNEAWFEVWRDIAERLEARGRAEEDRGHTVSARSTFLKSSIYLQFATAFMSHSDPRRAQAHADSVDTFGRFASLSSPVIEKVEVPYEGASFPAWFVSPPKSAPATGVTVFYLPGWDSTKEQGVAFALDLAERGIATLLCDGPGVGEAVLFRGLVNRYDYEVPGAAAYDYLAGRSDVDARCIAVVGASLGGYRAARVAAFEHRLAASVAWGAMWDFKPVWLGMRTHPHGSAPTPLDHGLHVMGARTLDQVDELLSDWNLEGVAQKIRVPFLVLHGADDNQIPVEQAHHVYETAGSQVKELKVFSAEEGGSAHCQNDNRVLAHNYIGDWLVDVLRP
jgi:dienelactone hydrolase